MLKQMVKFYAVKKGRIPGIYSTWDQCKEQTIGFGGSIFKSFPTRSQAEAWIKSPTKRAWSPPRTNSKGSTISSRLSSPSRLPSDLSVSSLAKYSKTATSPSPTTTTTITPPSSSPTKSSSRPSSRSSSPTARKKPSSRATSPVPENAVDVYCDGSCLARPKASFGGVGVWFGAGDPLNISEPLAGERQTNQRAELTAAIRAIEAVDSHYGRDKPIQIFTDSIYTKKCITLWIQTWKKNNWKSSGGQEVKNQDLIWKLDSLTSSRAGVISWVHVYGHNGNYGNEEVDKLAVAGALANESTTTSIPAIDSDVSPRKRSGEKLSEDRRKKKK